MESEPKKISFGFTKSQKKPNSLIKPKAPLETKKVELIECLEGQSIKIKDKVEEVHAPLVIPIKDNQKNLLDRVRDAKSKQVKSQKEEIEDTRPDSELTIEELAARELLREAKDHAANKQPQKTEMILPLNEDKPTFDGEKEPTLEDYEAIPISDYGLAMLRGMGWKEGVGIGKSGKLAASASAAPELRPKGLGLGATKMIKNESEKSKSSKENEELQLVKGAFAKILAGNQKGNYCEVLGFDDEAGRVIVKTSLKSEILNLNEFMLCLVTKDDFAKGSKVINNAKYDEYKSKDKKHDDNENGKYKDTKIKREQSPSPSTSKIKDREETKPTKKERNSRSRSRKPSPSTSKKSSASKKYNSDSLDSDLSDSSDSDSYHRRRSKKDKSKYRDRSRTPKKKHSYRRPTSSEDSDYCEKRHKEKKRYKSKSKNRDKSLSESEEERRHRNSKKKKSKKNKYHKRSSSNEDDYKSRYKR